MMRIFLYVHPRLFSWQMASNLAGRIFLNVIHTLCLYFLANNSELDGDIARNEMV